MTCWTRSCVAGGDAVAVVEHLRDRRDRDARLLGDCARRAMVIRALGSVMHGRDYSVSENVIDND